MATQTRYPSSYAQYGSEKQWTNPENACATGDSAYATGTVKDTTTSFTNNLYYNWGFTIPAGSTINSVTLEARCYSSTLSSYFSVAAYQNGTLRGSTARELVSAGSWTIVDNASTGTWSVTELNSNTLAGGLSFLIIGEGNNNTNRSVYCDYVRVTVDYTEAAGTDVEITATVANTATAGNAPSVKANSKVTAPTCSTTTAAPTPDIKCSIGIRGPPANTALAFVAPGISSTGSASVSAPAASSTEAFNVPAISTTSEQAVAATPADTTTSA